MSFTVIPPTPGAKPRQLDKTSEPKEQLTVEQLDDKPRLQRLFMSILLDIAKLLGRWTPDTLDFEDVVIDDDTGVTLFRFEHRFGGRVRWWVVDWSSATEAPSLFRDAATTDTTLVLTSKATGTVTLRVERAG